MTVTTGKQILVMSSFLLEIILIYTWDQNREPFFGYYPKTTADHIRRSLTKLDKINAVVFYDPLTNTGEFSDSDYEVCIKKARTKSAQQLRKQVQDFLEWAKYEGVLDKLTEKEKSKQQRRRCQ